MPFMPRDRGVPPRLIGCSSRGMDLLARCFLIDGLKVPPIELSSGLWVIVVLLVKLQAVPRACMPQCAFVLNLGILIGPTSCDLCRHFHGKQAPAMSCSSNPRSGRAPTTAAHDPAHVFGASLLTPAAHLVRRVITIPASVKAIPVIAIGI